jgi:hypothetical protein
MMCKPVLTIVYQFNPGNTTIGVIKILIATLIKYNLPGFGVQIGVTGNNSNQRQEKWEAAKHAVRLIKLLTVLKLQIYHVRDSIWEMIKYIFALLGQHFPSNWMLFHELPARLMMQKS